MSDSAATRGVYRLPWIGPSGQTYYVAVDRHGRKRFKATVIKGHDSEDVIEALWDLLDNHDPEPSIRLVS